MASRAVVAARSPNPACQHEAKYAEPTEEQIAKIRPLVAKDHDDIFLSRGVEEEHQALYRDVQSGWLGKAKYEGDNTQPTEVAVCRGKQAISPRGKPRRANRGGAHASSVSTRGDFLWRAKRAKQGSVTGKAQSDT